MSKELTIKPEVSIDSNETKSIDIFDCPTINKIATGKNLRRLRKKAHLSVSKVADKFCGNISDKAIYAWENGEYMPDYTKMIALGCLYGGYTFDDIIVLTPP